jgi:rare lipoprotein A
MRGYLCGALCALSTIVVLPSAGFANGSYGWRTDLSGQEWMHSSIGRAAQRDDEDDAPRVRRPRAPVTSAEGAPQRRLPRVTTDDVGTGRAAGGGMASYYWQPQRVASGGWFNPNAMTAAHKTLPFGTKVRVTHRGSGRSVTVTINDRGPYVRGRVIDLSSAAAGVIGMKGAGVVPVSLTVLGR